jgi:hypothetical protein
VRKTREKREREKKEKEKERGRLISDARECLL